MGKLQREFYQRAPEIVVEQLPGKFLVYNSPKGRIMAMITDAAVAPHIRVRDKDPGQAVISLNIKGHCQLAVTAGEEKPLRAIVIREAIPMAGVEIMKENFRGEVFNTRDMTRFPGSLCKSFGIAENLHGQDLTGARVFLEDMGIAIDSAGIGLGGRDGTGEICAPVDRDCSTVYGNFLDFQRRYGTLKSGTSLGGSRTPCRSMETLVMSHLAERRYGDMRVTKTES